MIYKPTVYRVQDAEGRGPFRPGFSHKWADEGERPADLIPWFQEFGLNNVLNQAQPGDHLGSACLSLETLRRWFSEAELNRLRLFGYRIVSFVPDRILAQSNVQVVFAHRTPLAKLTETAALGASHD